MSQCFGRDLDAIPAQNLRDSSCVAKQQRLNIFDAQRFKLEDLAVRDKGRIDAEKWVFRGCAIEDDEAILDVAEQHVLLVG